jgi:hypothetical protein
MSQPDYKSSKSFISRPIFDSRKEIWKSGIKFNSAIHQKPAGFSHNAVMGRHAHLVQIDEKKEYCLISKGSQHPTEKFVLSADQQATIEMKHINAASFSNGILAVAGIQNRNEIQNCNDCQVILLSISGSINRTWDPSIECKNIGNDAISNLALEKNFMYVTTNSNMLFTYNIETNVTTGELQKHSSLIKACGSVFYCDKRQIIRLDGYDKICVKFDNYIGIPEFVDNLVMVSEIPDRLDPCIKVYNSKLEVLFSVKGTRPVMLKNAILAREDSIYCIYNLYGILQSTIVHHGENFCVANTSSPISGYVPSNSHIASVQMLDNVCTLLWRNHHFDNGLSLSFANLFTSPLDTLHIYDLPYRPANFSMALISGQRPQKGRGRKARKCKKGRGKGKR